MDSFQMEGDVFYGCHKREDEKNDSFTLAEACATSHIAIGRFFKQKG